MPRFRLGEAKPGTPGDRTASEREGLKAVKVRGHERLKKGRTEQMAFRLTPDERRKIEDLADMLGLSFTDTLIKAVEHMTDAVKKGDE